MKENLLLPKDSLDSWKIKFINRWLQCQYIYIYIYIDKLDDRVNKYNNMYPSTIKMKPVDIESITYIDFNKENNKKIS